jgi:glycosyltransferase involved in cell wall biosynthesis
MVSLARKLAPMANRLSPGKHKATTLIVANQRTKDAIDFLDHPNIIELVENGVDIELFKNHIPERKTDSDRFRLVYMGRLPRLKALDVTLKAVARAHAQGVNIQFDILGDGSERKGLEALAVRLGIDEHVRFHGFLSQDRCVDILHNSDALVLNSLRECGGAVVLEAMSIGLPVIAADWGGPADYVDASCGILVSPVPRESFAERLADAFVALAGDAGLRRKMGAAGAQKIRDQFDWNKKIDTMLEIYADAMKAR